MSRGRRLGERRSPPEGAGVMEDLSLHVLIPFAFEQCLPPRTIQECWRKRDRDQTPVLDRDLEPERQRPIRPQVVAGPCNAPRSNRLRTRASLISVIADPRSESTTWSTRASAGKGLESRVLFPHGRFKFRVSFGFLRPVALVRLPAHVFLGRSAYSQSERPCRPAFARLDATP